MNLSPTELDRLVIFSAAEFARRNLRHRIRLSHPEAVAFLTDEAMLLARMNVSFHDIRARVAGLLSAEDVQPGVPTMLSLIMVELPMEEGTKLLAIFDPITPSDDDLQPGEVLPAGHDRQMFAGEDLLYVEVLNTGDRDIQVRSFTHFFEVNRALAFDRAATYGRRLALPSGAGVRFEPGIPKRVALIQISGDRIVLGQAGLVNGFLDDPGVRRRAIELAVERGYLTGDQR